MDAEMTLDALREGAIEDSQHEMEAGSQGPGRQADFQAGEVVVQRGNQGPGPARPRSLQGVDPGAVRHHEGDAPRRQFLQQGIAPIPLDDQHRQAVVAQALGHALPQGAQAADARSYAFAMHPGLAFDPGAPPPAPGVQLPGDLLQDRNALEAMIAADPVLQALYSPDAFRLELGDDLIALPSQLLKPHPTAHTLARGEKLVLHVPRSLFSVNCEEELRNTLYLQMLRDTPVVYGDEGRAKQEHLFTYQLFASTLTASDRFGPDHLMADLAALVELHSGLYRRGVLNNLFFTTGHLRDYHYQKQKNNAFYHIQAMNLPFQNLEFYYL